MTLGNTGINGIGSAVSSAAQAAGNIAVNVIQYQTAKAMIASQERIATRDFNFQMARFDQAEELDASVENITRFKNETVLKNAEAHRDKAIAQTRLAEIKKTREAGKLRDKKVVSRVLGQRRSPFYGDPVRAT